MFAHTNLLSIIIEIVRQVDPPIALCGNGLSINRDGASGYELSLMVYIGHFPEICKNLSPKFFRNFVYASKSTIFTWWFLESFQELLFFVAFDVYA